MLFRSVKKFAIQKMGELFRQWKKRLWATYKKDKKPPKFTGYLLQQEENWDKFVEHKNSEDEKQEVPCLSGLNKSVRCYGIMLLQNPSEKTGT